MLLVIADGGIIVSLQHNYFIFKLLNSSKQHKAWLANQADLAYLTVIIISKKTS